MKYNTKFPGISVSDYANAPLLDIACPYDHLYGLEELSGINQDEIKAVERRKNRKKLKLEQEMRRYSVTCEKRDIVPVLKVVHLDREKLGLISVEELYLKNKNSVIKVAYSFAEILFEAKMNDFFNPRQCSFDWYGLDVANKISKEEAIRNPSHARSTTRINHLRAGS